MNVIEAYKSVDGKIFENESEAISHDQDCIGELFDALLLEATGATNGDVTRNAQYRMCLRLLEKRQELKPIIGKLYEYIVNEPDNDHD